MLRQILDISSATTPALEAATAHSTTDHPYGRPRSTLVMVEVTRAAGPSPMTGATFVLYGSRDAVTWVGPLRFVKASDATGTVVTSATVNCAAAGTYAEGLATEETRDWPWIRVTAQATGADAGAGDSAAAWVQEV